MKVQTFKVGDRVQKERRFDDTGKGTVVAVETKRAESLQTITVRMDASGSEVTRRAAYWKKVK